jgi:hypothetical protein
MAKRTKRQTRSQETTSSYSGSGRYQDFNPDYTPVIEDLKRIGTLAGAFILILIVLSFFI